MSLGMPVTDGRGETVQVPLPDAVVAAATCLVDAPRRYFEVAPDTVFIPVSSLVLSHVRQSGIDSALKKMAAAYHGSHDPRPPISVRVMEDGKFLVLDGNSTSAVAIAAGWSDIPCVIQT